jgi:hypothetical protein
MGQIREPEDVVAIESTVQGLTTISSSRDYNKKSPAY